MRVDLPSFFFRWAKNRGLSANGCSFYVYRSSSQPGPRVGRIREATALHRAPGRRPSVWEGCRAAGCLTNVGRRHNLDKFEKGGLGQSPARSWIGRRDHGRGMPRSGRRRKVRGREMGELGELGGTRSRSTSGARMRPRFEQTHGSDRQCYATYIGLHGSPCSIDPLRDGGELLLDPSIIRNCRVLGQGIIREYPDAVVNITGLDGRCLMLQASPPPGGANGEVVRIEAHRYSALYERRNKPPTRQLWNALNGPAGDFVMVTYPV
ncbi:hypothetical protein GQ53DRAFT_764824 [Thozetella sp. PMI_491]|nr:hypothetical protein GQ53DRAFT_764824 [Thozetella sp. PMI_491]